MAQVTCQADISSARDSSCVRGMFARFRRSVEDLAGQAVFRHAYGVP